MCMCIGNSVMRIAVGHTPLIDYKASDSKGYTPPKGVHPANASHPIHKIFPPKKRVESFISLIGGIV